MGRKKKETTSLPVMKLKIALLILLIVAGFVMTHVIKKPARIMAQNTTLKPATFDTKKLNDISNILNSINLDSLKKKSEELKAYVLGTSDTFIQQKASEAGSIATDFVFDAALKPILSQIEKLPANQREQLQQAVCK